MITGDFIPSEDANYQNWLNNFSTQCAKFDAELNLDTAELAQISSAASGFQTSMANVVETRTAAKGAVSTKVATRRSSQALARAFAREFKAIPGISPDILNQLGIVAPTSSSPVTTVTAVSVTGCDDGVNSIIWNRNGNTRNTVFLVEYKVAGTSNWLLATGTTKTSFKHINQEPGVTVFYRITSTRAGISSAPSVPVAAYPNTDGAGLSIAA